jgi:hypothetical protein
MLRHRRVRPHIPKSSRPQPSSARDGEIPRRAISSFYGRRCDGPCGPCPVEDSTAKSRVWKPIPPPQDSHLDQAEAKQLAAVDQTPSTLEEMMSTYNKACSMDRAASTPRRQEDVQTSKIFELPREIRDIIYNLLVDDVIGEEAIELAPFTTCYCNWVDVYAPHGSLNDSDVYGAEYHFDRWTKEIRPLAALLRTCRQFHKELTPVFYGQPFKFTSDAGWMILFYWLKKIGPRNRQHLKDVTVCHPALSMSLTQDFVRGDPGFFFRHLDGLQFSIPVEKTIRLHEWDREPTVVEVNTGFCDQHLSYESFPYIDFEDRWPGWHALPHPAEMLATVPGLREFKLVANRRHLFNRLSHGQGFEVIAGHPIYSYLSTQLPKTQLSVIEFVHFMDVDRLEYSRKLPRWALDDHEVREIEGSAILTEVAKQGWEVNMNVYDQFHNYPNPEECPCINKRQCEHVHKESYSIDLCSHQWGYDWQDGGWQRRIKDSPELTEDDDECEEDAEADDAEGFVQNGS